MSQNWYTALENDPATQLLLYTVFHSYGHFKVGNRKVVGRKLVFNAQATISVISGRNTIRRITIKSSLFAVIKHFATYPLGLCFDGLGGGEMK